MTASPAPAGSPPPPAATDTGDVFRDAVRFWEVRRIWYNLILLGIALAWVVGTWPHFRPAMTMDSLLKVLVLALLANLCYSAAYLVDIPLQHSGSRAVWRRRRWVLWLAGTLFAILFANYWIADEIYPFVTSSRPPSRPRFAFATSFPFKTARRTRPCSGVASVLQASSLAAFP